MTVSELDLELLEVLTLQVAWYMICGEFANRYGGPGPLATRLTELRDGGLVSIRNMDNPARKITAAELEADAIDNNCYEDLEETRDPLWDMVATDSGYALVAARLGRQ